MIEHIYKRNTDELRFATVLFTTVHKAKGLEWDIVRLAEDISSPSETDDVEEVNILYVACTRAKKQLYLNRSVALWMKKCST
eukprot:UN05744